MLSQSLPLPIDLHDVAKIYPGRVQALRGIEMRVHPGEIFALLGPNGAGKSTLVKIIMSVVRPTRAKGSVLGRPIGHKPTLGRIGYLPENHRFPRYLTGRQVLHFFAALAKVDRPTRRRRAEQLLDLVEMKADADRRVGTYSKGMMQRIGLAQALVHDPQMILLDEPTDGVDPMGRRQIRLVLQQLRSEGKTVFINSHMLSELELICDRVAILISGQIARQGTLAELAMPQRRYEIDVQSPDGPADAQSLPRRMIDALPGVLSPQPQWTMPLPGIPPRLVHRGQLPGGRAIEFDQTTLRIGTVEPADIQAALDRIRAAGLIVTRVQEVKPSLEDLFMQAVAQWHPPASPGAMPPRENLP